MASYNPKKKNLGSMTPLNITANQSWLTTAQLNCQQLGLLVVGPRMF